MKKILSFVIPGIFGILLLGWVYVQTDINQLISILKNVPFSLLFSYILVIIISETLLVKRWEMILKAQNLFVPFRDLFAYKEIGFAIGYLSPQSHLGGEPVRALCLKRHHINFKKGISTILIDKSLTMITDAFFAIIGLILILYSFPDSTLIYLGIFIPGIILIIFYIRLMQGKPTFTKVLSISNHSFFAKLKKELLVVEEHVASFFKYNKEVFFRVIGLNIFLWGFSLLEYKLLLLMFGFDATFLQIFMVIAAVSIAYLIPVPMSMGVLELGQVSVLEFFGISKVTGIAVSVLIRAKDLARTGLGLFFLPFVGIPWENILGVDKWAQSTYLKNPKT